MKCKLFVFRHAETTDNSREIFSGWRDSVLTSRGLLQAQEIAKQLSRCKIDYTFTSHLTRARQTLKIVLEAHPPLPVFVDDRLIERCYGLLQGRSKRIIEREDPDFYARFHRGYYLAPPEGESLEMVDKRVMAFFSQLREWLTRTPSDVAISCHSNSIRPFRRVFENLSLTEMCTIESPQDRALIYELDLGDLGLIHLKQEGVTADWEGIIVPKKLRLATDSQNPLRKYY
jgi:2,3-bisphosphoglycerate-dependent phosphoglycerate mutase